jgi:multiple sugar transport system substrate-binding protein
MAEQIRAASLTRRAILGLLATAGVGAVAAACGGAPASPTAAPTKPAESKPAATAAPAAAPTTAPAAATAAPAAAATPTTAAAAKPATKGGQTVAIMGIGLSGTAHLGNYATKTPKWEAATGHKVKYIDVPFDQIFDKFRTSTAAGTVDYDVLYGAATWEGDVFSNNLAVEVTNDVKAKLDWDDVMPMFKDALHHWNGKTYGVPIDGDTHHLNWREDAFTNPEIQAKYKSEFGADLKPPQTWDDYYQIAKFFQNWDWDKRGKPNYGVIETMGRSGGWSTYFYLSHASPYVKHVEDSAFHFDPDTMKPRINSPGFVKALEDMVKSLEVGPPGMSNFTVGETLGFFIGGQGAMQNWWSDVGSQSITNKNTVVKNKLGFGLTPGAKEVYNHKAKAWEKPPGGINFAPYLAWGGWGFWVMRSSKVPDVAFDVLTYLANKENSMWDVLNPTGLNPWRKSHFEVDPWVKVGFSKEGATSYLKASSDSYEHKNRAWDLRVPSTGEYYDTLESEITKAYAKQVSPQQALDNAAALWEKITDRLGRTKQIEYYKASLNLNK